MKVLISGASGFVGEALVRGLNVHGHEVRATNRRNCKTEADSNYIVGDLGPHTDWHDALTDCDVVIHLAARVHKMAEYAVANMAEFFAVNLHGTANLARQAAKAGIKRFVYVSSIKVNGEFTLSSANGERGVFRESDHPHPQDAYAISKWEAEQALRGISQKTGMELVIVRPPLVYGPRVKANFAKLLTLVDRGIPLPLGNVQNSRSLIYVGNLVDALITCAAHPAAAGQTYLVSDGEDVSIPQLIQAMADALHRPGWVFPVPLVLMRGAAALFGKSAAIDRLTQSLVIDGSKIRSELGWKPPYTMAQGLQTTAEWYRQSVKSRQAQPALLA
ncbi:NAD-dependent dehydratase [Methylobacillus sp. MM3]|jgi:nucleoside-diphosphate-sugar epimerase|uniref:UDP-glucose 4-epimerase family protein n=1 Tax=Methylobacillus sp. MM3 TaxID=1848039 RepID=UPI0007E227B5|nr:SDR family oxidoreductase [Methylobacillus sp. MM3]OAJ71248.1 NAD-dependent dehydratase [Methylobacillus sp. MM3]